MIWKFDHLEGSDISCNEGFFFLKNVDCRDFSRTPDIHLVCYSCWSLNSERQPLAIVRRWACPCRRHQLFWYSRTEPRRSHYAASRGDVNIATRSVSMYRCFVQSARLSRRLLKHLFGLASAPRKLTSVPPIESYIRKREFSNSAILKHSAVIFLERGVQNNLFRSIFPTLTDIWRIHWTDHSDTVILSSSIILEIILRFSILIFLRKTTILQKIFKLFLLFSICLTFVYITNHKTCFCFRFDRDCGHTLLTVRGRCRVLHRRIRFRPSGFGSKINF